MPTVQLPPFGYTKSDNGTVTFIEMISNLGSGVLVLPLISLMEDIAICKAFGKFTVHLAQDTSRLALSVMWPLIAEFFISATGKSVNATQELLAIGMANIGNSFVQAFPSTGSLSRSAVNNASGVRTPMGGIYTGKF